MQKLQVHPMRRFACVLIAVGGLEAVQAEAVEVTAGNLTISAPWARATPKGAQVGAGYFTVTNKGSVPDRLLGGASEVSEHFEIHEMKMDNGIMRMREMAQGLEIKPGETVAFKPGGGHVMFVGLKGPLTQGQQLKATLSFEKAGKVDVSFTVQGMGAQSGGGPDTKMRHGH